MRFGITPIEVENIASVFKKEKGLDSFLNLRFSDIILEAIEKGYQHCEISLDLFQILPIQMPDDERKRLKTFIKEYGITYSAHFPIWSIELVSPNKFIRDASVQSLIDAYNTFKFLEPDIEVFVLHPSGAFAAEIMSMEIEPKYKEFVANLFVDFAVSSVKKLVKETKMDKTKIAIENIEFPFQKTLEIIKKLKGPNLCIDTAHFLGGYSGDVDLVEVAEENLDITSEIHLQDYNSGGGADHAALGTGQNFPVNFLKTLHAYNFKGPIVFELTFQEAKESIEFIKNNVPEIKIPVIKN